VNHSCVCPSECSAGCEVSRRDLRASGSSPPSPQQGGLKAAHDLPKVVLLVSTAWWRFFRSVVDPDLVSWAFK
jgi:hypothetical protein